MEEKKQIKEKIGRVVSLSPEGISVYAEGEITLCSLRGNLKQPEKKKLSKNKNLICIGDFVSFSKQEKSGAIETILPRKTVLGRADNLTRHKQQLIAANIDQVLITVSVVSPPLKPALIDRYIIATQRGGMKPIIVINKIDLLDENSEEQELFDACVSIYNSLRFEVHAVSSTTKKGIGQLKKALEGRTSVFSGQSGVGKSSLINLLLGTDLVTSEVVVSSNKGAHTTTAAHLVPLEKDGFCIDTPGIKSFGVWNLTKEDLALYFCEIAKAAQTCHFRDCSHQSEPHCNVKLGLESGLISLLRYNSYQTLLAGLSEIEKPR